MTFFDMPLFMTDFFDFLDSPMWRAWPFNAGYGESLLPAIARLAFICIIFGAIVLFLRVLFGPNGYFRDEELDREADELRKKELKVLEKQFENNEITEAMYLLKKKQIKS